MPESAHDLGLRDASRYSLASLSRRKVSGRNFAARSMSIPGKVTQIPIHPAMKLLVKKPCFFDVMWKGRVLLQHFVQPAGSSPWRSNHEEGRQPRIVVIVFSHLVESSRVDVTCNRGPLVTVCLGWGLHQLSLASASSFNELLIS